MVNSIHHSILCVTTAPTGLVIFSNITKTVPSSPEVIVLNNHVTELRALENQQISYRLKHWATATVTCHHSE